MTVELKGHLIDSLLLSKVMDEILERGGNYEVEEIKIGKRKEEQSYARLRVYAPSEDILKGVMERLVQLGAVIKEGEG